MARAGREHVDVFCFCSVRSKRGHRASRGLRAVLVDSFPSAVLTTLRIAEGRYGTREANEQLDLASNALKGNVLLDKCYLEMNKTSLKTRALPHPRNRFLVVARRDLRHTRARAGPYPTDPAPWPRS